jgi:hypothetical protein
MERWRWRLIAICIAPISAEWNAVFETRRLLVGDRLRNFASWGRIAQGAAKRQNRQCEGLIKAKGIRL